MMSAGRLCAADVTSGIKRLSYSTGRAVDLSGIFPPIATPFLEDESIAYDKLEENIKKWNKIPFKVHTTEIRTSVSPSSAVELNTTSALANYATEAGYVVQGSNGEYPFLTPAERVDMVKRVKALIPKDKLLISGSACESTRQTIEMTNAMAESGADAVLVLCPSYFKASMTLSALTEHFTSVADGSKVPVILYNMPANTGIDMTAPLITSLASHPNIIGLKDSGGDVRGCFLPLFPSCLLYTLKESLKQ
uniref:4-hydroxy-2-oxoglutarate aldolase, mitochondrial n=1 Tax=Timema douglasi TaxID=61478 RepID=A0A7R8VJ22_TIMDO|nr:unnamed protein product [Timema douglasi]